MIVAFYLNYILIYRRGTLRIFSWKREYCVIIFEFTKKFISITFAENTLNSKRVYAVIHHFHSLMNRI